MGKNLAIHFIGIKGVGMTPLAIIAKEAGFKVTGCDIDDSFITDEVLFKKGIKPLVGFSKEHITQEIDLVVTTGAHGGFENLEVEEAKKQNIKVITQGEAVGLFMDGKIFNRSSTGISIAGTHGKTTTTAMIATILKECGKDPSFIIGTGNVASLDQPGHFGRGEYFIAEADEYATEPIYDKTPKFLWQHPKMVIMTNIELDHPDLYPSVDAVRNAFLTFANQLPSDGLLIVCGDDKEIQKLLKEYNKKVITYGNSSLNDFVIKKISVLGFKTFFWIDSGKTSLGEFIVNVPGEHNASNALAAIITCLECGLNIQEVKKGLVKFTGTKRRFEYIGKLSSGGLVFDDYAHHPTEIKKTLKAFRQTFPKKRIICVFQPHTYSRTKKMFEDFIYSFNDADSVLLTNIYPSLREKPDPTVSSKLLFEKMSWIVGKIAFLPNLSDVIEYIKQKQYNQNSVIVTMGAGDIYKISEELELNRGKI